MNNRCTVNIIFVKRSHWVIFTKGGDNCCFFVNDKLFTDWYGHLDFIVYPKLDYLSGTMNIVYNLIARKFLNDILNFFYLSKLRQS